jgi:hypothetical protein
VDASREAAAQMASMGESAAKYVGGLRRLSTYVHASCSSKGPPLHPSSDDARRSAADHSTILRCAIYNSTNLPLSLNFTDEAPLSQLYGPVQIIPAV